jgi:hypothetical protein
MAETTAATKNTTVSDNPERKPKTKQQTTPSFAPEPRKILQFAEPEPQYCEPTSSKVKVEDLITAEQELAQNENKQLDQNSSTDSGARRFWDRPVPKPQHDWPYDPRMPDEWNEVIASMHAHERSTFSCGGESS